MPRPDVSEERKEQILDAAAIVFSRQGFAHARMDDIVEESGLSKGALYWYFKSKDEIIYALMHRFFDQDLAGLSNLLDQGLSVRETLLQYAETLAMEYQQIEPLTPLMYDYYATATRDEDKREFFQLYFQQYRRLIRQLVERGIEADELNVSDVGSFVLALTAMIEGLLLIHTIDRLPNLKAQFVGSVTLLLDGMRTR